MKNTIYRTICSLIILILGASFAFGQDDKTNQELAVRMVKSASVKPGDVVQINGGTHMIPLMEAIAIEVQKAGGMPNMLLDSDRVTRSLYTEVEDKYLEQEPRYFAEWLKVTDVYIGLPSSEDPKALIEGVPEERFAKLAKSGDFLGSLLNTLPVRVVSINFPNEKAAERVGLDYSTFQKMTMDAINADYEAISAKGDQLKQMVQNAKQIRVTNPAGTDFTFSPVKDRLFYVNDGIVTAEEAKSKLFLERFASLPGGEVDFAPLETSANGKVVVTKDTCKFQPMNNVSFEFKNGKMKNFKAGTNGQCFEEIMKAYTGPKDMLGVFSIGLNPALQVMEEGTTNYRPGNAAGLVYIGLGDNQIFGGKNKTNGGFSFPITNATVTIDGKTIIKDGKLIP